jgi:hypothetical protein
MVVSEVFVLLNHHPNRAFIQREKARWWYMINVIAGVLALFGSQVG